jgi:hydrogenase maturation protease
MNAALVDRIVHAVLYEGYILYPYRPSVKNRQRWTFGGLVPRSYSEAQGGSEACAMQTECLVRGGGGTTLTVQVRFLQLQARRVEALDSSPDAEAPAFRPVESLWVGAQLHHTWQEAVEREVVREDTPLTDLAARPRVEAFAFPPQRQRELLREPDGRLAGALVREQQGVEGSVELSGERIGDERFRVRVRILNRTPLDNPAGKSRDEALMHSLVSTHTILVVRAGEFISLLDPPEPWREAAAGCQNEGTWPVLVGEPGETDTLLSSPIILYDYPQVAPESPGDLFDATEIDEILTLRILTLTDAEKQVMAAVDERARALLQRTEALTGEQLLGMHGTMRELRPPRGEDHE